MNDHVARRTLHRDQPRAYSYSALPSFLSALCIGGTWRMGPVNCCWTAPGALASPARAAPHAARPHRPRHRRWSVVAPQQRHGFIGLWGIQLQLAELGGRAKAQRQHARGERIERAGMARFLGAQQPFRLLQGVVARKASGLSSSNTPCTGRRCTWMRGACMVLSVLFRARRHRLGDQGVHVGRTLGGAGRNKMQRRHGVDVQTLEQTRCAGTRQPGSGCLGLLGSPVSRLKNTLAWA